MNNKYFNDVFFLEIDHGDGGPNRCGVRDDRDDRGGDPGYQGFCDDLSDRLSDPSDHPFSHVSETGSSDDDVEMDFCCGDVFWVARMLLQEEPDDVELAALILKKKN